MFHHIVALLPLLLVSMPLAARIMGDAANFASAAFASDRIDTHFHALPPAYLDAVAAAGGDPSGFSTPDWSIEAAIKPMDAVRTSISKFIHMLVTI